MRRAIVLLGLFIVSCTNRTGIPKDIIPPEAMQGIMLDLVMASQYTVQHISRDSLIRDKIKANQELLEEVFTIHHTTRKAFRQSLNFYESRPDLNKKIFDSLSAYANRHQKDLYKPSPITKPHAVPVR